MSPSPPPLRGFLRAPGWGDVGPRLESLVASPPHESPLAALDFDETCLRGDVSEGLLGLLDAESGSDARGVAYAEACARDRRAAYVELAADLLAGRTEPEAHALADRTLGEGIVAVRQSMRELVWALHRHGWDVWVVSASAEVLVQALATRLGIHPHRVLGIRAPVDAEGRYERRVLEPVPYREGKVEALLAAAGRAPSLVVGDSQGDQALMEAAKQAVLVDRGDVELRAWVEGRGGWVVDAAALR